MTSAECAKCWKYQVLTSSNVNTKKILSLYSLLPNKAGWILRIFNTQSCPLASTLLFLCIFAHQID